MLLASVIALFIILDDLWDFPHESVLIVNYPGR
jgi:hypothetical protein